MWLAEDAIWITVFEQKSEDVAELERDLPLHLHNSAPPPRRGVNLKLTFPGANPHPRLEPFDRLATVVSYFIGNDPDQWHPNVPVWGGVRYVGLYPGIDLEITGENGRLVQRLVTQPGADLSAVRLRVQGADAIDLLPSPDVGRGAGGGGLRLTTAVGEFTMPLLTIEGWNVERANVERVSAQTFKVTSPFSSAPLLPGSSAQMAGASDLLYSTFLGGNNDDQNMALTRMGIAIDGSRAAYVTGETLSMDFPTTPGAFDTDYNGGPDAFVVKLNTTGSVLAYGTFLGGSDNDEGESIAIGENGVAYVTGVTKSQDFPTTPDAFDTTYNGYSFVEAFVVKLNTTGSALAYATFLGGSNGETGEDIAVDGSGAAYVTGYTFSSDFPTTTGAFDTTFNGDYDAFVVKLNTTGSALAYATFLGGWNGDMGRGIALDGSRAAYITGETRSPDFPTTLGAFDTTHNGRADVFMVKLNATGSTLTYATFLGGSYSEWGWGIAVDGSGAAYVTGHAPSSDFPTTPGAFNTTHNGRADVFMVKLNATGSTLAYATFLGSELNEAGVDIAVDGNRNAYVAGVTDSPDFPTTAGAFDTSYNGGFDAFVAKLAVGGGPGPTPALTPTPMPTSTPKITPTFTPSITPTPTSYPGPPRLIQPADGAVLPQPVPPNEWYFSWSARTGPCHCSISIIGPGERYLGDDYVPWWPSYKYEYRYTTDEYLPDDALEPWYWQVYVHCPLGSNQSEIRTFSVEPAPTPTSTLTPMATPFAPVCQVYLPLLHQSRW